MDLCVDKDKYKNKGLTGLANLGNTCYINSCMQILSHCHILNNILDNRKDQLNNNIDSILVKEWIDLKALMWSKNCTIAPKRFINIVQNISRKKDRDLFTGYAQNDLPEFLIFIFECFHNSLQKNVDMGIQGECQNNKDIMAKKCYKMFISMYKNDFSDIIKNFYGISVSLILSKDNQEQLSIIPEPFCLLNLPIPDKIDCDIYDCLNLYTKQELLENENAWFNEKTNKKEDVFKCINFWSLPNILIIDFKRFDNKNKKINCIINTPLDKVDLSQYIIGYDKKEYIYELFGVCNHHGGCLGGHYTANIKNLNNKWYNFNDTSVIEISDKNVITNNGYCYFYKKI
jgi:ubiquitin carboxyl-terminal hydrolase 8